MASQNIKQNPNENSV